MAGWAMKMGLTLLVLAHADCRGFADEVQQKEIEVQSRFPGASVV